MQTRLIRVLLYFCFLFSGASGLIFETVWMRKLSLIFGNTIQAASIVIAVFMGGLALGSWIFGRLADSSNRLLRLYIFIELGIAASGLIISLFLMPVLDNVYIFLHHLGLEALGLQRCGDDLAEGVGERNPAADHDVEGVAETAPQRAGEERLLGLGADPLALVEGGDGDGPATGGDQGGHDLGQVEGLAHGEAPAEQQGQGHENQERFEC